MLQVTALHSRLRSRVTAGAAPEKIGPDDELPLVDEAEHDHEISQWMNPADYRKYLEDVRAVAFASFRAQSVLSYAMLHSLLRMASAVHLKTQCGCKAGGTQLCVSVLPWLRLCLPPLSTANHCTALQLELTQQRFCNAVDCREAQQLSSPSAHPRTGGSSKHATMLLSRR